jgi:hypothetical protein
MACAVHYCSDGNCADTGGNMAEPIDEIHRARRQSGATPIDADDVRPHGDPLRDETWPDPDAERAQPGDVLGIEREGETTSLGETREDEDNRRRDAVKEAAEQDKERVKRP